MISKNQVKHITSLHHKKNREKKRLFIVEGVKMMDELLKSSCEVHSVYALEEWVVENALILENKEFELTTISAATLEKISTLTTPQKVLALVNMPDYEIKIDALEDALSLVLDDVSDPGNLGTIIRVADWFGIRHIVCSENTVELYNPKVVQATMGSLFRVMVHHQPIANILKANKNTVQLPVYAAVMGGESIYTAELKKKGLIILGNESMGIERDLFHYVDHTLTIPSFSTGSDYAESLNVAIATAVVCSEFRRRR